MASKRKSQLHEDWSHLGEPEINALYIGKGTVAVTEDDVTTVYKLHHVYVQLLQAAYERGVKGQMPW